MTPLQQYQNNLRNRGFQADPAQAAAVKALQQLFDRVTSPTPHSGRGVIERFLRRNSRPAPLRGLYLWGDVGRGKSWLIDSFYECLPLTAKRRIHFHRFMQEIHRELKLLPKSPDPLPIIAKKLTQETKVLCLDEFHVNDIADAMLLSGFLKALFDNGIVLVTSSNTPANELYQNGLQRERFLPAIALLQQYTDVVELDGAIDYRLQLLERSGTYHRLEHEAGERLLSNQFTALAPELGIRAASLQINNREIRTIATADDVVWFNFSALCETPRSAADYLEISTIYHTVLLSDVPSMDESKDDSAQRFIHLIDALYDHKVKVIISAAVYASELYRGQRHEFAFRRTTSRLQEMSSQEYLAEPHRSTTT